MVSSRAPAPGTEILTGRGGEVCEGGFGAGAGEEGGVDFHVGGEDGDVGAEVFAEGTEEGGVGGGGVEGLAGGADHADGAEEDCGGALWRARSDYVDATEPEELGRGEEVAVVRVNFAVAMLGCAGEVQGVGGPQKNGGRSVLIKSFHPLLDRIGQGQPNKQAVV